MGEMLKAITSGFSRFALSWLLPSLASLGLFALLLYPHFATMPFFADLGTFASRGLIEAASLIAIASMVLSTLFALASLPVYRTLEGYAIPRPIARRLYLRQVRRWMRLRATIARLDARSDVAELRRARDLLHERIGNYPSDASLLLPTRLGNALKASETYGYRRFGLDSQALWYEVHAVAPDNLRRDSDDARAAVDFFVALVTYLMLLAGLGVWAALYSHSWNPIVSSSAFLVMARLSYSTAVRNMTDWRFSVQAVVNLGRLPLAKQLGYVMPRDAADERMLWTTWSTVADAGNVDLRTVQEYRESTQPPGQTAP